MIDPTPEQLLRVALVEECSSQFEKATGHKPKTVFGSVEFFQPFAKYYESIEEALESEPEEVVIIGITIRLDLTLKGLACYAPAAQMVD